MVKLIITGKIPVTVDFAAVAGFIIQGELGVALSVNWAWPLAWPYNGRTEDTPKK